MGWNCRTLVVALSLFLGPGRNALSQSVSIPPEEGLFEASALFPYSIRYPEGQAGKGRDLVIALHGFGSSADRFLSLSQPFVDAGMVFASLQAPYPLWIENRVGYSWVLSRRDRPDLEVPASQATLSFISAFVDHITTEIEPRQVVLLGFSQGASFAYLTGLANPVRFRALVAMSGAFDPDWFSGDPSSVRGSGLEVLIVHGKTDRRIAFQESEKAREFLESAGLEVALQEHPEGHVVPAEMLRKVASWIRRLPERTAPRNP